MDHWRARARYVSSSEGGDFLIGGEPSVPEQNNLGPFCTRTKWPKASCHRTKGLGPVCWELICTVESALFTVLRLGRFRTHVFFEKKPVEIIAGKGLGACMGVSDFTGFL